jgi:hypothetical protein
MEQMIVKRIDRPEETRPFAKGRVELIHLGDGTVGRATFEPGWKWSECVGPIAGTESCEASHLGVVESGRMHVRMDDGQEAEMGPGEILLIPPGHDAWVVGDEACVVLDFAGMEHYAERTVPERVQANLPPSQPNAY